MCDDEDVACSKGLGCPIEDVRAGQRNFEVKSSFGDQPKEGEMVGEKGGLLGVGDLLGGLSAGEDPRHACARTLLTLTLR